jgi:hypothetical protein
MLRTQRQENEREHQRQRFDLVSARKREIRLCCDCATFSQQLMRTITMARKLARTFLQHSQQIAKNEQRWCADTEWAGTKRYYDPEETTKFMAN